MEYRNRETVNVNGLSLTRLEKTMRREVANSNERRRMQNINNGFDDLKALVVPEEDEKISKAGVLRRAVDYLQILEEYNNLLINQNRKLKRLLAESDKGNNLDQFNSPVKRKLETNKKRASKCKKLKLDTEQKGDDPSRLIHLTVKDVYNFRSSNDMSNKDQQEAFLLKNETTPSSFKDESFGSRAGARRSLESIIEAINQLEGEERLNSSYEDN